MVNISVIIPVYNAEPYLRDCLNSINLARIREFRGNMYQ